MKLIGFIIGYAVAAACLFAVLGLPMLGYSGYCSATWHRQTDDELISVAIGSVVRNSKGNIYEFVGGVRVRSGEVPYESIEEFKTAHPVCCKIGRQAGDEPAGFGDFINRVFGREAGIVSVDYMRRRLGVDGVVRSTPEFRRLVVTNCGKVRWP